MVMSYIKGANRCIFTHIHPRAGWYVSYTPWVYYTHLEDVSFQLTTGVYRSLHRVTKFSAKMTFILFTSVHLSIYTPVNNKSIW